MRRPPFPWDAGARAATLVALAAALASCSDLPTRPRTMVTVTGVVLDRDGSPLPGAALSFRNEEFDRPDRYEYVQIPPQMQGITGTGSDGRFELSLWSGRYTVSITGPYDGGYGGITRKGIAVGLDAGPLTFQFQGVWLRGSLFGPDGVPVEDGHVEAYSAPGQPYESHGYHVREHTYEMLLPPGRYYLDASPYFTNAGIPTMQFGPVSVRADTTVDLALDGTRVDGVMRGPGGETLPGVAITVSRSAVWCEARALADGSFTLYVPPGVYVARLYPPSYIMSREAPLVVGETPVTQDFDLSGVTWTGIVRWRDSGLPVLGSVVIVSHASLGFGSAQCTADAAGAFRLVVPAGGLYELAVSQPGHGYQHLGFVAAGGDSTFDIQLEPAEAAAPRRSAPPR